MPWPLMRRLLPMSLFALIDHFRKVWSNENTLHMRKIADRYAQRAAQDGDVVQKTGEIIPRESA